MSNADNNGEVLHPNMPVGTRRTNFFHQRIKGFCMTLLVMLVCFPLYYQGFFGNVEGPLEPENIGAALAAMGVTQNHVLILFLSVSLAAMSWNWIYNLIAIRLGLRLTCIRKTDEQGTLCGATARRIREKSKKSGQIQLRYVCANGHKCDSAHFHLLKKGMTSNVILIISLMGFAFAYFHHL